MCVYTCVIVYMHEEVREQPQIWLLIFHIVCDSLLFCLCVHKVANP